MLELLQTPPAEPTKRTSTIATHCATPPHNCALNRVKRMQHSQVKLLLNKLMITVPTVR
jgi:hypothetical protein